MKFQPEITGDFRLTKDPDLRYTATEKAVVNIRAVGERYMGKETKDGKEVSKFKPVFLTFVAWKEQAELYAEKFKKGDLLSIRGVLDQRSYKPEGSDKDVSVIEVLIDTAILRSRPVAKAEVAEAAAAATGDHEQIPT